MVSEIVWTPLANGEIAAEFIKLPLWHFENRTGELRFIPSATGYDGVPMPGGRWMVTTGAAKGIAAPGRRDEPAGAGRVRQPGRNAARAG